MNYLYELLCFDVCVYSIATTTNTIQITLQMQIENPETSLTPPTPSSPGRDAQSPEGIASLSSGSSDNALGKYNFCFKKKQFLLLLQLEYRDSNFFASWKSFYFSFSLALSLNQIKVPTNQKRWSKRFMIESFTLF